jgi:hypothetical protein
MASRKLQALALGTVVLLAGCSLDSNVLWPSEPSDAPYASAATNGNQRAAMAPPTMGAQPISVGAPAPLALGTTNFVPPPVSSPQATGTFVGQKVSQHRNELRSLQGAINEHNRKLQEIRNVTTANAQRYHGTVAAITARLQLGTTPGNPVLVNQWNAAQLALDRIGSDITSMTSLGNSVASDSAMSAYLLESLRATYGLSGAIDEDHRQLAILEDETNRTVVMVDRLLNELSEDIARQTAYVGNARGDLTTLSLAVKNGEMYGASLANRAFTTAAPMASLAPSSRGRNSIATSGRRPLVVIRFDRPDVPYQQALYTAVKKARDRKPSAQFDLVAVAPSSGSAAQSQLARTQSKRYAQDVLRTLNDMGLPSEVVTLSATTSGSTSTNEVHIYVR